MAITAAALQAVLGTSEHSPKVLQGLTAGTKQDWYVIGGITAPGKAIWCQEAAAGNAATQGASVLAKLAAWGA